jgi:hypothetical protein
MPSSVPASQGYRFSILDSTQEQFLKHNSKLDTPTIQSGEGSIIDTIDMRWCRLSTLNTANVFPVILG